MPTDHLHNRPVRIDGRLPDRRVALDRVDQEPAGVKGVLSVSGRNTDEDSGLSYRHRSHAVLHKHLLKPPTLLRLLDEPSNHSLGHRFIGCVVEMADRPPTFFAAHHTKKLHESTVAGVSGLSAPREAINEIMCQIAHGRSASSQSLTRHSPVG